MSCRRRRPKPSVTELHRVEQVLESDPALRLRLGPKTTMARKQHGEPVHFSPEAVAVTEALRAQGLNPERVGVKVVLAVGAEIIRVGDGDASDGDRATALMFPWVPLHR
jgi:hypothetical protein